MILQKQLNSLLQSKFSLLSDKDLILANKDIMLKGIEKQILSTAKLASDEVSQERWKFFNLPGTTAEEFKERIIQLSDGKFVLAGIRFRGLNVELPFVSVIPSFKITDTDIPLVREAVRSHFKSFKPKYFQMSLPHLSSDAEVDRYTVVGIIKDLIEEPAQNIKLKKPESFEKLYPQYLKEYEAFHESSPELKFEVRPESFEDLKDSHDSNLLYTIEIGGKLAGLIAGSPYDYYGLKAIVIIEELLFKEFRGKGFGPKIQKAFLQEMKDYDLVWGTIAEKNIPSLKTALKTGREIYEVDYKFPI